MGDCSDGDDDDDDVEEEDDGDDNDHNNDDDNNNDDDYCDCQEGGDSESGYFSNRRMIRKYLFPFIFFSTIKFVSQNCFCAFLPTQKPSSFTENPGRQGTHVYEPGVFLQRSPKQFTSGVRHSLIST